MGPALGWSHRHTQLPVSSRGYVCTAPGGGGHTRPLRFEAPRTHVENRKQLLLQTVLDAVAAFCKRVRFSRWPPFLQLWARQLLLGPQPGMARPCSPAILSSQGFSPPDLPAPGPPV